MQKTRENNHNLCEIANFSVGRFKPHCVCRIFIFIYISHHCAMSVCNALFRGRQTPIYNGVTLKIGSGVVQGH